MKPHISVITLGVRDVDRAKRFYADGLGWPIHQEQGPWVAFEAGGGRTAIGLLQWDALADDAGAAPEGSGFRGITLSYIVGSAERVDAVLAEAEDAGATIVKPAQPAWGGRSGCFADPDGHCWKVAWGPGDQPFAAE
ncbi:MAG: VOC family protein [Candidatus Dormibacteria bacterium]